MGSHLAMIGRARKLREPVRGFGFHRSARSHGDGARRESGYTTTPIVFMIGRRPSRES